MREASRNQRQEQIEEAAYRVLERKGYAGATMLAIAREAKASNETLYGWYGDKTGLFRALVARNAQAVRDDLQARIARNAPPMDSLAAIGPALIALLTHPRAIALNRAAAAEPGGVLARTISEAGRETVGPLIVALLERARDRGELDFSDPREAFALYLDLLVGDLQHRRVIGLIPPPDDAACMRRGALALSRLSVLCGPGVALP